MEGKLGKYLGKRLAQDLDTFFRSGAANSTRCESVEVDDDYELERIKPNSTTREIFLRDIIFAGFFEKDDQGVQNDSCESFYTHFKEEKFGMVSRLTEDLTLNNKRSALTIGQLTVLDALNYAQDRFGSSFMYQGLYKQESPEFELQKRDSDYWLNCIVYAQDAVYRAEEIWHEHERTF